MTVNDYEILRDYEHLGAFRTMICKYYDFVADIAPKVPQPFI